MTIANHDQAEHWNHGPEVEHWLTQQHRYDGQLAPFNDMLIDAVALAVGNRVLDIGCGCGATTITAARLAAPGEVIGVDLSAPMLDRARTTAAQGGVTNARFEQGDAQVHPFGDATVDVVISRFGIMFFADPVAALANLRRATRAGGRIAFACWQPLTANQWLLVPSAAVAEHVPLPDLGPPGAPGMFAFAEPDRPRQVLADAGWHDIDVASRHTPILIGGGGTLDDTVEFLRTGSIGRTMLAGADADTAARVIEAVRDALTPYAEVQGVRLDAAVWLVTARA